MNEVTTTSANLVSAAVRPASSSSVNEKDNQGGKTLPPVAALVPKAVEAPKADAAVQVKESVQAAVAQMNEYVQSTQRDLHFSYDPSSGDTIVRVVDRSTQQVIRQIPDEIFLKLARSLSADEPVHLFSAQA